MGTRSYVCYKGLVKGGGKMVHANSRYKTYLLAAILGAIGGGLVVVLITRAIPKMMASIMRNMMSQMGEDGCTPGDM